ncbi:MAG: tetratricopeptide repeat protein [Candidatus Sericytochromatia bacterium]
MNGFAEKGSAKIGLWLLERERILVSQMQASMLSTLQEQASSLGRRRQDQAAETFRRGIELLRRAVQQQLRQGELLEQARQVFLKAHQLAPSQPEPYLGLSYLLILFQSWSKALGCLQKLLALAPEHPEAQELLAFVKAQLRPVASPRPTASPSVSAPDVAIDALRAPVRRVRSIERQANESEKTIENETEAWQADDELSYDIVSRRILSLARECMGEAPEISLVAAELEENEQLIARLREQFQDLSADVRTLSQEEDTLPLSRQLVPIEKALHRHEQMLSASRRQQGLAVELRALETEVAQMAQLLRQGPEPADCEQRLETWLDRCDHFADSLDAFEKAQQDISGLLGLYNKLVRSLEQVQDLVEELP